MNIKKQKGKWYVTLRTKKERNIAETKLKKEHLIRDENGSIVLVGPFNNVDGANSTCATLKK